MAMKDRVRRGLQLVPPTLFLLAFVHPLAKALARWDWRFDLLSHFQEPALAITLIAIVAMLWTRRRSAVILFILAAFQAEPAIRYGLSNPVKPANASGPRLRVLMANVLVDNDGFEPLSRLIREVDPDIVGLVEVSDAWIDGMADVAKRYPYRLNAPDGPRGLALWFKKRPIAVTPPENPTPEGWPFVKAAFMFDAQERHIWLMHPASPMRRRGKFSGFPELQALAKIIAKDAGSTIVMGDFNTTDGSPYFRDFETTTGLRDSRYGFGRQGSWPVGSPYLLAIDHCFVSDDWAVVERKQGHDIGSDHRPFWFELAPAAKSRRTVTERDSASSR